MKSAFHWVTCYNYLLHQAETNTLLFLWIISLSGLKPTQHLINKPLLLPDFLQSISSVDTVFLRNCSQSNFLSELIIELCSLIGIKKINTSGYHPQTDGLVEKFNTTLQGMIAKCSDRNITEWDKQLPFFFFAFCLSFCGTGINKRKSIFPIVWSGPPFTNGKYPETSSVYLYSLH